MEKAVVPAPAWHCLISWGKVRSTLDYDYKGPEREESPVDLWYQGRMLVHRLMRVAHEDGGGHWAVEALEELRELHAAQMAFALAHLREYEESSEA